MRAAALIATLIALAGAPAAAASERWVAPVAGGLMRGFAVGPDPFAGGQHRGADFAAAPGAAVRAACGGAVVVAGRVGSSGRVVTVRCGRWRVTHQSLAEVAVVAGERVASGARIGTVAPSRAHAGLHLGVRREGRRFGYVDPLRFIGADRPPPVLPTPRLARRPPALRIAPPPPAPAVDRPFAPWPAWLGLGLLLAGAVGAGARWLPRRRYGERRPAESRRGTWASG